MLGKRFEQSFLQTCGQHFLNVDIDMRAFGAKGKVRLLGDPVLAIPQVNCFSLILKILNIAHRGTKNALGGGQCI